MQSSYKETAEQRARISRINSDSVFVTETSVNQLGTAEGALLPPPQKGQFRVPFVYGLRVAKRRSYLGGTEFTLTWLEPEGLTNVSHYNVYVTGLLDNNKTPQGPSTVQRSPAVIRLVNGDISRISFIVQTQLKNGMVSDLLESPTVSSETLVQGFVPSDLNGVGTTGQLLTWTGATATLIGPGATNEILTGDGVAIPVFRSRATLDLVEGRSALTTANRIVLVGSAGVVTQLGSLGTTTTVLHGNAAGSPSFGAVSLTTDITGTLPIGNGGTNKTSWTAGSVVFAGAGGTALAEDNANLFYDDTNNRLGVATTAPKSTLESGGTFGLKVKSIVAGDSPYTAAAETVILADATGGNIIVNLPVLSGVSGRIYHIKKTDSSVNTVTLDGDSSETIDGATTQILTTQYQSLMIFSGPSEWSIL